MATNDVLNEKGVSQAQVQQALTSIKEAQANIGKKVVLLPETHPYSNAQHINLWTKYDLYGLSEGKIISVNDAGNVEVEFECEGEETAITGNYLPFRLYLHPKHIALVL